MCVGRGSAGLCIAAEPRCWGAIPDKGWCERRCCTATRHPMLRLPTLTKISQVAGSPQALRAARGGQAAAAQRPAPAGPRAAGGYGGMRPAKRDVQQGCSGGCLHVAPHLTTALLPHRLPQPTAPHPTQAQGWLEFKDQQQARQAQLRAAVRRMAYLKLHNAFAGGRLASAGAHAMLGVGNALAETAVRCLAPPACSPTFPPPGLPPTCRSLARPGGVPAAAGGGRRGAG